MAITINSKKPQNFGSQSGVEGQLTLDSSYPTGGYSLTPAMFSLSVINSLIVTTSSGDILVYNYTSSKLMAFTAAGGAGGSTGSTSAGTPAGTNSVSAVTGTGVGTADGQSLSPEISGVGTTAVGQVITTTDNQTCALNQFRGKWLVQGTATTPPNLILSNTAAAAAPVSFTVQGVANTDAGSYDVLSNAASAVVVSSLTASAAPQTFVGTAMTGHTHTVAAGGGGLTEVANGTNLSTVVGNYIVFGQ